MDGCFNKILIVVSAGVYNVVLLRTATSNLRKEHIAMHFLLSKPFPDDIRSFSWLIVIFFSAWGGVVRFLMDRKSTGKIWSWTTFFSQLTISCFTGFLGGLYGYEHGWSDYMTLAIAGLCSTLGGTLLRWLWDRLISPRKNI